MFSMLPDSQHNLSSSMQFLPQDELSQLDPEVFPLENVVEERKRREKLIKQYVDFKTLASIASGLGKNGISTF